MPKTQQAEQDADDLQTSPLNSQVLATVAHLSEQAKSGTDALAQSVKTLSSAMVTSIAGQDAVAHLRRMEILSETATSVAVNLMAEGRLDAAEAIVKTMQASVDQARKLVDTYAAP